MRILYDHEIFYLQKYGGISNYYYQLSRELIKTNIDLKIICPLHKNSYISNLPSGNFRGINVNILPYHFNKLIGRINLLYAKEFVKKYKPDIIHKTYYSRNNLNGKSVCTVYDLVNEKFRKYFKNSEYISELKKKTIDNCEHIICISENTKKDLIDIFKVPENKISVTLLASSYTNKEINKNKKFKNHLLFVGSRKGYKNYEGFLNAISISEKLRNNFKFIFYGGEKVKNEDINLIKKHKISFDKILFLNDKNFKLSYMYSNVEALIYPSLYEGFGIPILEAMNFGCPVISSDAGSLREVGGDGISYFDPSDPENMAHVIEKKLFSKEELKKSISYGFNRTNYFSWSNCAEKTLNIYKKLISS